MRDHRENPRRDPREGRGEAVRRSEPLPRRQEHTVPSDRAGERNHPAAGGDSSSRHDLQTRERDHYFFTHADERDDYFSVDFDDDLYVDPFGRGRFDR